MYSDLNNILKNYKQNLYDLQECLIPIKEIAETIRDIIGYTGDIEWDHTKPDGMPRKVLDVTKIHELGWNHTIDLEDGIKKTYQYFLSSQ